jgi:hypothetical protein
MGPWGLNHAVNGFKASRNIYRILNQLLETGGPAEIERHGKMLKIVPAEILEKLDKRIARPAFLRGDPEDLMSLDWSREWQP